jgi:hypothetical protein
LSTLTFNWQSANWRLSRPKSKHSYALLPGDAIVVRGNVRVSSQINRMMQWTASTQRGRTQFLKIENGLHIQSNRKLLLFQLQLKHTDHENPGNN